MILTKIEDKDTTDAVALLNDALRKAKEGNVQSLAVVLVMRDGTTQEHRCFRHADLPRLNLAVDILKRRIVDWYHCQMSSVPPEY